MNTITGCVPYPARYTNVPMQDVSVNLKVPVKTFHCLKSTGSHFTRTFFKISENLFVEMYVTFQARLGQRTSNHFYIFIQLHLFRYLLQNKGFTSAHGVKLYQKGDFELLVAK